MKFAPLLKHFLLLTAMLVLAACGGGGDSGSDSVFDPPGIRITATPTATSVDAGEFVDVTVRVTQANGSDIANGTTVRSVLSPASLGTLQYVSNGTASGTSGGTVGGLATFRFTAGQAGGNATLTFSVDQGGRSVSTSVNVTVNAASDDTVITITLEPETISVNGVSAVKVEVRTEGGAPVPDGTVVTGVTTPSALGALETTTATTVGGVAAFRYQSAGTPGTVQLTFSVGGEGSTTSASATLTIIEVPPEITVTLLPSTIPLNGRSDIRVEVGFPGGAPVPDGTTVSAIAVPSSLGILNTASATTVAGLAAFEYQAQSNAGVVELRFSVTVPSGSSTTSVDLTIAQTDDSRLKIEAVRTTLPVNQFAVSPFFGSPYMSEVTVTVKDSNGQPVNEEDGIQVSVNPVGNTGGFSMLDDPETDCEIDEDPPSTDGCEFLIRMGQAPVDVVAGKATLFMHSLNFTGTTTMYVTTQDPVSGTIIAASLDFHIVETLPPLPTLLTLTQAGPAVYVQGSGGNSSSSFEIGVYDGLGQPVPDPVAGNEAYNNYILEIVGDQSVVRETLRGIDAAGNTVSGKSIALRTTAGIGAALLTSGDRTGSVLLRLTSDSADNNVDNGIQEPVSVDRSVVISDGRLWDIDITYPVVNALEVNPSDTAVEVGDIPVSPDGSYSITVSAIATDRLGNPVLPGTTINFGLIDEPQATGIGDFRFQGGDGDPQEGGKLFTATSGQFLGLPGVDDAVGPGDGLVVFGEDVPGNRDLESARVVEQVISNTSLSVTYRFNHNDDSGATVDDEDILPYIIGRAADGNIVATGTTDEIGVVRTKLNYPVSKLGKTVVIWAQGDGDVVNGNPETVTDVEFATFAGARDLHLTVSPNLLWANGTDTVELCVTDYAGMPVGGVPIKFAFNNLIGIGSVDGASLLGSVASLTAFGTGCTTAQVTTGSITDDVELPTLVFSVPTATAEVEFTVAGSTPEIALIANPTHVRHTTGGTMVRDIALELLDGSGAPIPGAQIIGNCTGSEGVVINLQPGTPDVTDANGITVATVTATDLTQAGSFGTAVCVFQTVDGNAATEVLFEGIDICELGPSSPIDPRCTEGLEEFNLQVFLTTGNVAGSYSVVSSPAGVGCSQPQGVTGYDCMNTQVAAFQEGTNVVLTTTGPGDPDGAGPLTAPNFIGWSGDCIASTSNPKQAAVYMGSDRTCTATWEQ